MHVKDFLAGKKSRCPTCQTKFRIPSDGEPLSIQIPMEDGTDSPAVSTTPVALSPVVASSAVVSPVVAPLVHAPPATVSPNVPPVPSVPVNDPKAMHWFVRPPSGGQFGPASLDILSDWIQQRRVTPESLIWREGWPEWIPANRALPHLFPEFSARPPAGEPLHHPISTPPVTPPTVAPPQLVEATKVAPKEPNLSDNPVSAAQQKALLRLKKKKRKQLQLVGLLSILAIILVIILIVVLIWNPAVQPPPGAK